MGSIEEPQPLEITPSSAPADTKAKKRLQRQQRELAGLNKEQKEEERVNSEDADQFLSESLEALDSSVEIASNTNGRIKEVIFQRGNSTLDTAFISFLQNRPDVSITMVVETADSQKDFEEKMRNMKIPISHCNFIVMSENESDISVWARDSYVMVKTSDRKNAVMEPRGRTRYSTLGDRDVAERIVATTGEQLLTSPLIFDGGDMRTSGEHLFVGAITIIQNIPEGEEATPDNVERVIKKFEKQFRKKIIVMGFTQEIDAQGNVGDYLKPTIDIDKTAEPVFHLDLYFTPINNNTVAIADLTLTKTILESMEDGVLNQREAELGEKGFSEEGRRLVKALKQFKYSEGTESRQRKLDLIAADMESKGFKVIRTPYFQDGDYPMSYNNALVENFQEGTEDVTQISLPQYGIPELDEAASKIYEEAQIRVVPIQGLLPGMYQMGALNCLTSEKRS